MRLITKFELAAKPRTELHALLREIFNDLACSKPNTPERRTALASIENIRRKLSFRYNP